MALLYSPIHNKIFFFHITVTMVHGGNEYALCERTPQTRGAFCEQPSTLTA